MSGAFSAGLISPSDDPTAAVFLPLGWREPSVELQGVRLFIDGSVALDERVSGETAGDELRKLIELYLKEGAGFLNKLRGSFALALLDLNGKRALLAVDPFATRSLYYWRGDSLLAFAPRISHLAKRVEVPKRIDPNSIYFYLNHSCIPAPFTIYRDIRRLEPGQYLLCENGNVSVQLYWDMSYPEEVSLDEAAAAELVRSSVEESVRSLLRRETHAGEELGAFLSGGTDSSTVVGLISRIRNDRVKTFSVGFDEAVYNEIHYARVAASAFNSRAHEYFVRPREALDAVMTIAEAFDEPFGNSSAIPTYFCLKMARAAGVKVMFSGDGGDELYGGNERYLTEKVFWYYQDLPAWLKRSTDAAARRLPSNYPWRKLKNYVRKANLDTAERYFAYQLYYREHANDFFTRDFREALDIDFPLRVPRRHFERGGDISPLNRLLYVDLKLAIADNDLFKVNRMAENHGIDVRYPYLDRHVALASGRIPARLKLKGWTKRYVFKKAFGNLLPREIVTKKKHGFGLPTGDWLRRDPGFRDLARSLLLEPISVQRGYFNRSALEALLRHHDVEQSTYYGSHIWNFMMLELWHRTNAAFVVTH